VSAVAQSEGRAEPDLRGVEARLRSLAGFTGAVLAVSLDTSERPVVTLRAAREDQASRPAATVGFDPRLGWGHHCCEGRVATSEDERPLVAPTLGGPRLSVRVTRTSVATSLPTPRQPRCPKATRLFTTEQLTSGCRSRAVVTGRGRQSRPGF
jgi:hypothetical protein